MNKYNPDYFANLHKNLGYSDAKDVQAEDWGEKFEYMGHSGYPGHCLIRHNGNVVICTEAPDNHGESITNAAEIIATRYCLIHNIPFNKLIWIEHYEHDGPAAPTAMDRPTYDLVTFDVYRDAFRHPRWRPINQFRVMEIFQGGAE